MDSPIRRLFRYTGQLALQISDFTAHVYSLLGTHASLSTEQARSKQGPTLRVSYVVSPIITSGPIRVPSAHRLRSCRFHPA
jgi:hypothetical protein